MIRTGTILDMDMASLGAVLREGWDWWTEELAGMIPARWRGRGGPRALTGRVAMADAAGQFWNEGAMLAGDGAAAGRRRLMHIVLPDEAVLAVRSQLPRLSQRDLARVVALDLDRLLPFPPGSAIAAACPLADAGEAGQARIATLVAAMPLEQAAALVEAARAAGIEPLSLTWRSPEDDRAVLDLLPPLVASGRITARRDGRGFWWGLVAALFLANIGAMIWRDVAATTAFAEEVDQQQATGTAARALAARIAREASLRQALVAERGTHDPLALLTLTSVALPEGAYVQRFAWTPATLRLTGYKAPGSDIQAALRRTGRFATLEASISDPTAESGGGQPFDVSAALAAPAPAPGAAANPAPTARPAAGATP